MAMTKCKECQTEISTTADSCPKCGAKQVRTSGCAKVALWFFIIVGVLVVIAQCSSPSSVTPTSANEQKQDEKPTPTCAKDDLQCLGDKLIVAAGVYCKDPIERLATHSVRWTDGTFETKFSRFRWANKEAGQVTMIGDKAEFQNGFGAFTPVIYECDFAADGETVLGVRVNEGRLPR